MNDTDIVFLNLKTAIFIDGEFWHGRNYKLEKNKYSEFWCKKIEANIKRDRKFRKILLNEGWKIIRLWDKDLKENPVKEINKILRSINYKLINKSDLKI